MPAKSRLPIPSRSRNGEGRPKSPFNKGGLNISPLLKRGGRGDFETASSVTLFLVALSMSNGSSINN